MGDTMTDAATAAISRGAIDAIVNAAQNPQAAWPNPVLQCLQIREMKAGPQGGPTRYRIVLSDIDHFSQGMLATQANDVVESGKLKKNSIVRVTSFNSNQVKEKRIVIVLSLEILEEHWPLEKLGNPVQVETRDLVDIKPQPTTISSNGFYGNKPQAAQPQRSAQALPSRPVGTAHANIYPIEALSPYAHKWTIKARCTHKSDIKTWHKQSGEGKLFSVNFLDESGEIRATGFNAECDMLYDIFQEGEVYYISSPCRVQLAKKQFTNLSNDYELTFERDTQVEKAEDPTDIPVNKFAFTSIGDLQSVDKDTTIDTIGVLKEVDEVTQITSKTTSKPYDKRDLTLVDNTGFSVRLTIWGNTATNFDAPPESVLAFKGVKVSDYNGRSLSLLSSGSMTIEPDIDEAYKLKGWYDASGRMDKFTSHASMGSAGAAGGRSDPLKTITRVLEENLGMSENPDYFTVRATIIYVKQDSVSYPACISDNCNKKVVEMNPGEWRCEKCDKTHPRPEYRYIMSVNVSDHTGQLWLSCFDDVGRMIMGVSADELAVMKENDEKAFSDRFQDATCKTWMFKCRAKMDNYQDQQRVRHQVTGASAVNYVAEGKKLVEMMKVYNLD